MKTGRQRTVIVPCGFDTHSNIQRATNLPPSDGHPFEQPLSSRDGQVELERITDQLAIAVRDQRHGAVLADINRDHQTPLRVKASHQRHVRPLGGTTSESHRQNLLDLIGSATLISGRSRTEDPL
jgi:hypothetical protein